MSTIPKTRIRIAADLFRFEAFNDVLRADEDYRPKFRAGDDIQFEIGFFNNGTLQDLSGIASVTLEIKPLDAELIERFAEDDDADNYDLRGPDLSLTPIRSKTIAASDLNTGLTETNWNSRDPEHCHALISLSAAESNIAAGDRWLTIAITTNDSPGLTRTVCAGPIRVLGGGLSQSASPESNAPETFYNTDEADARFLQLSNNLADLSDTTAARENLGLGETATPTFAGLNVSTDGVVDFHDNRLTQVGDASAEADALNRRIGDARYLRAASNLADLPSPSTAREQLDIYSKAETDELAAKPFGASLYLDGVSGYIALPNPVPAGEQWTFAAEVQYAGSAASTNRYSLCGGVEGPGGLSINYQPSSGQWLVYNIGGPTFSLGNHSINDAKFHRVAVSGDSGLVKLYVDGALVSSVDTSADTTDYPAIRYIGVRETSLEGLEQFWTGYFKHVAVFNLALSASEIAAIYTPQPTWPRVPPIYRWAGSPGGIYSSDWSAGLDGWGTSGLTTNPGQTVDGVDDALVLTSDTSTGGHLLNFVPFSPFTATSGLFLVSIDYYFPSSNTVVDNLGLAIRGSTRFDVVTATDEWVTLMWVIDASTFTSANAYVYLRSAGQNAYTGNDTDWAAIRNLKITQLGALAAFSAAQDSRIGSQLHDASPSAYDGVLSETGATWTAPNHTAFLRVRSADASSAMYLIRGGDILPANAVVTSVIVDGQLYPASGTQTATRRRIRLLPDGSSLDVQRSSGGAHETIVEDVPVASLSDVDIIINYQTY